MDQLQWSSAKVCIIFCLRKYGQSKFKVFDNVCLFGFGMKLCSVYNRRAFWIVLV